MRTTKTNEKRVTRSVKDDAKAEVPNGREGSVDGSNELPIEIAPIDQVSKNLPAIPFQPETFLPLPAHLQSVLDPQWKAPITWGFLEWLERADTLTYFCDGISRLDALLCKRTGEALWHVWNCFRKRKEEIKAEGGRLKYEPMTWTKLLAKKKWNKATVSRRIRFYCRHRDTPDNQLDGATISKMWTEDAVYLREPPAIGEFYRVGRNCRQVALDEGGQSLSTQINLEKGAVIEVTGFNDGNYNDTLARIKTGKHAGKCFTTRGVCLFDPVDASKVPDLVKSIEDAREAMPMKPKSGKLKSDTKEDAPSNDFGDRGASKEDAKKTDGIALTSPSNKMPQGKASQQANSEAITTAELLGKVLKLFLEVEQQCVTPDHLQLMVNIHKVLVRITQTIAKKMPA